jgi:glucosyl-dolichyl phosphate glucuronosyltransferase
MTRPFVSVIVATRNRAQMLAQVLDALGSQTLPAARFEIIAADNLSTDDTRAVIDAFGHRDGAPSTRYLFVDQPGKSYAVNAALALAQGDLIAFTDDDVLPSPGWLEALVGAFDDDDVAFATGRILPWWEIDPPSWMSPALYGAISVPDNGVLPQRIDREHTSVMALGGNLAVRRAVIGRIGGLRADLGSLEGTLRTGEDHEFFLRMVRADFQGRYVPEAVVRHFVPRARLTRQYFRDWLHLNGQVTARLESIYVRPGVPYLFGVPRYLWRQAVSDALESVWSFFRGNERARFAAALRVRWFAGYVTEAWRLARHREGASAPPLDVLLTDKP